ncbi:hypothetical protein AB4Z35_04570 [Pseudomonas sp. KB_15]|uniref:hypothetical protein n=1 Tax=Pseudomonas sp. KB_15 TaxID=3233035 RepID=UPI003F9B5B66
MNASLVNASSMSFVPIRRSRENQASAPSLVAKLFNLLLETASSTAPQMKQGAIFLIDGHPVLISTPREHAAPAVQEKTETLSLVDQLNAIKDFLGLTVTQISELFKVTRKTVYDWYDGADPRPNFVARISALYHLVRSRADKLDLKNLKKVWNLPLNGQSFIDLINTPADQHQLEVALSEKLDELAPRMISPIPSPQKDGRAPSNTVIGGIIRDADSR